MRVILPPPLPDAFYGAADAMPRRSIMKFNLPVRQSNLRLPGSAHGINQCYRAGSTTVWGPVKFGVASVVSFRCRSRVYDKPRLFAVNGCCSANKTISCALESLYVQRSHYKDWVRLATGC